MTLSNSLQLNKVAGMDIIDSILNAGNRPSLVISRDTFEIIYQNKNALELFGDKVRLLCHEVFNAKEVPCLDCPIMNLSTKTDTKVRYNDIIGRTATWEFTNIAWINGKQEILATMVDNKTTDGMPVKEDEEDKRDRLTDIPNHPKFYKNAEKTIFGNPEQSYAIIIFDIDKFKTINDLYGMSMGDEVLKHISNILKEVFAEEENYGRMHSDMFAFYITYSNKGEIIRQIEKIRKKIYANNFDFDISTSYGIYLVQDLTVPVNLMCDRAMIANRTTKGNVLKFCAFYDEHYREDMLRANEIEIGMNKALENGDFKMYLQPKYRLSDGELCGAEVLCRWLHAEKGLIPPIDFIPLFEKNGFIIKLDEYMWELACKTLRNWIDEGRTPLPLSVNISRYHIKHNDLEVAFTNLIKKYNIPVELLTLEITESLFLDNPEELNRELIKLQNMGLKLEVDDFGTGFSSLNLIRNVSVDTIKIDKDFLDSEMASDKGKIVINHTIDMAKDLRLQVIAEGVETAEHVEFLKTSRCDIAQGFYFAKPMPLEEFNKLPF